MDYTGTGNSLNPAHPSVLRLIMDSLRYFVGDCHVDGFRFDLASALAREFHDVDRLSAFFDIIHQDPILSQVKLIAEPWDVGEGGYQVGNFPVLWTEWNGIYRDVMRDFWRGQARARRLRLPLHRLGRPLRAATAAGRPRRSTSSPRTTASRSRDLVSYNEKHNEANLEENRDGTDDNRSWNCGVEGPTDDPEINALRERQQRNFLATLFLSQGVPMLRRRRRARPHPGRQQQRLLPGQRDLVVDWDARRAQRAAARLHAAADRAPAASIRSSGARPSSPARGAGTRSPTSGGSGPTGAR